MSSESVLTPISQTMNFMIIISVGTLPHLHTLTPKSKDSALPPLELLSLRILNIFIIFSLMLFIHYPPIPPEMPESPLVQLRS